MPRNFLLMDGRSRAKLRYKRGSARPRSDAMVGFVHADGAINEVVHRLDAALRARPEAIIEHQALNTVLAVDLTIFIYTALPAP